MISISNSTFDPSRPGPIGSGISNTAAFTTAEFNGASAASASAVRLSGAINTAGTGTTTIPHWLIQPSGTTAGEIWATTGTIIGINLPSPWNGNFADWKVAGVSLFKISPAGSVFASGSVNTGVGKELSIASNLKLYATTIGVGTFRNYANDKDAQISVYGVRCVPVTLAALTAAYPAATNAGMKAFITDSTVSHASMYVGGTAVGGGSHFAPVYSNGTNYVIG